MSVEDLEIELSRLRAPDRERRVSRAMPLTVEDALQWRAAGNLPDEHDRSLRLVLQIGDEPLSERRLRYEPDFHEAPTWRRPGSRPINVVPIGARSEMAPDTPWWEQPDVADLEREWQRTGRVGDLRVPAGYRSFVLKTISSLRAAASPVTVETIAGSLSRWLSPAQVAEVRKALEEANL